MDRFLFQRLSLSGDLVARDPLSSIALVAGLAGTAVSAMGTIGAGKAANQAGIAQQQSMQFKAAEEKQAADESRAASQRSALEHDKATELQRSRLQALAAASGGGADDPTVVHLGEDLAGRGEYQHLMDMYTGENRARGLEDQATGDQMTGAAQLAEGKAKQNASYYSAAGTVLSGAGSMFDRYSRVGRAYG